MTRSNSELLAIRSNLKEAFEKEFGIDNANLAVELRDSFNSIYESLKLQFLKKRIGHLYDSSRTECVDFIKLREKILFPQLFDNFEDVTSTNHINKDKLDGKDTPKKRGRPKRSP